MPAEIEWLLTYKERDDIAQHWQHMEYVDPSAGMDAAIEMTSHRELRHVAEILQKDYEEDWDFGDSTKGKCVVLPPSGWQLLLKAVGL